MNKHIQIRLPYYNNIDNHSGGRSMSWEKVKEEALIKCRRHCCYCKKHKGINIEVHHITPKSKGGKDTFDNAIPLCFDCHAMIGSYNPKHPKGNKISESELKSIRDEFYKSFDNIPMYSYDLDSHTTDSDLGSANLLRELWIILEDYSSTIDYAYGIWSSNFKNRYPNIHKSDNGPFNLDYEDLQNEIDSYEDTLYKDFLDDIFKRFNNSRRLLIEIIKKINLDLSKELYDEINEYYNCMTFSYANDGPVGSINYYWSSFFVCLDENYEIMKSLKNRIDKNMRIEFKHIKTK